MSAALRIGFFTRVGDQRSGLEDALVVDTLVVTRPVAGPRTIEVADEDRLVVAVFDGMGGHAAGHRASSLAAIELSDLLDVGPARPTTTSTLAEALAEAGRRLVDDAATDPARDRMGTTVAGLELRAGTLRAFNVGDSRAYLLQDGYLCQYTVDHTGPSGGLTACLGGGLRTIRTNVAEVPWSVPSAVLLCTDGLYRHVPIAELEAALQDADPIGALWRAAAGAADDCAVVLLDARPPAPAPDPLTADGLDGWTPEQPRGERDDDVRPARPHRSWPWRRAGGGGLRRASDAPRRDDPGEP